MTNDVRTKQIPDGELARPAPSGDYHARHDPDDSARLSTTVVHALADVMGQDATDVEFVLSDSVDPEALDRLFGVTDETTKTTGHVAFSVDNHLVTVYSDGQIVITPPGPPR
jgi:hypothetical protein